MKPKPSTDPKWLAQLFIQVYDDYFVKTDNKDAVRYLELLELTSLLEARIHVFRSILQFHWGTDPLIWNHPRVIDIRNKQIAKLNEFLDIPINLEGDFDTEIQTALNVSLGIIQNDHSEAMMELEALRATASKSVFDYYDSLQQINEANGQAYGSDLLLPEYVAAEKSAIKKAEKAKLKTIK